MFYVKRSGVGLRRGKSQLGKDLSSLKRGPAGSGKKIIQRNPSLAFGTDDLALGVEGQQRRQRVAGRGSVADIAAYRGQIPNLDAGKRRRCGA